MDAAPEPDSNPKQSRRSRGWRLAKVAARLVRRDPSLIPLSLIGAGCTLIATAGTFNAMAQLRDSADSPSLTLLLVLVGIYVVGLLIAFFSAAIAIAADAGFDEAPMTVREAIAETRELQGPIALWALLATAVGFCIELLVAGTGPAANLAFLLWSFFAAFAIPLIALDCAVPGEALRESALLARRRWAEELSGGLGIGACIFAAALGGGIVLGVAVPAFDDNPLAALVAVAGALGLAFLALFAFATVQAFTVALYRHDRDGGDGPALETLERAPAALEPGGRGALGRVAGLTVGIVVVLTATGLLMPRGDSHRQAAAGYYTPENGYFYAIFPASEEVPLVPGSAVVYRRQQVGVVVATRAEGSRVVVWFRGSPGLEPTVAAFPESIGTVRDRPFLRIGPSAPPAAARPPA